jgi:hypothetical protein
MSNVLNFYLSYACFVTLSRNIQAKCMLWKLALPLGVPNSTLRYGKF